MQGYPYLTTSETLKLVFFSVPKRARNEPKPVEMMAGKAMQTKVMTMGNYRQKPDVGSGDKVTETLLEITPLARQGFPDVVNCNELLDAVNAEREERLERQSEVQVLEARGNIITTQASIEIAPTETGRYLT